MRGFCPDCEGATLWAVNYDRGERICRSCNREESLA